MADESLTSQLTKEARPLTAVDLPSNFSFPLTDFLLRLDMSEDAIIQQANAAASGAYQAQVASDSNAESLAQAAITLDLHDKRIFTVEQTSSQNASSIAVIERAISDSQNDLSDLTDRVDFIETDYVSKTETTQQSLASSLNVTTSYSVDGVQVVAARNTGWTPAGGTVASNKGAWNPNIIAPASATYTKAEIDAIILALNESEARTKALEETMRYHGLID